ncbi:MAG: glycosyltransferase [Planctomycetes bacterium]|nr:glycosyltransferase [Planctomycetota bacterium]
MTLVGVAAAVALATAALPALLVVANLRRFAPAPPPGDPHSVSALVPARNEAEAIDGLLDHLLASRGVDLEVVVLDDDSRDDTGARVAARAAADPRVRLLSGQPLPAGWCGKQHACAQLAAAARHETLAFVDADVRLAPDALARGAAFLDAAAADLVSGFPRQITGQAADRLLLPLIHFILLGFLPLGRARAQPSPALAAGCGQWFITRRAAYERAGGHAAIRRSLHDGVMLPRAFRRAGLRTDIFDATDVASCRMYDTSRATLAGLAKNATEGIGAPRTIVPFTVLLVGGQVLPWVLVGAGLLGGWRDWPGWAIVATVAAAALSAATRIQLDRRFTGSAVGWLGHPLGVAVLVAIQWWALARKLAGAKTSWRGRSLDPQ